MKEFILNSWHSLAPEARWVFQKTLYTSHYCICLVLSFSGPWALFHWQWSVTCFLFIISWKMGWPGNKAILLLQAVETSLCCPVTDINLHSFVWPHPLDPAHLAPPTWPLPPAGLWWRVVARARRFPQGGYFQEHVWSVGLTGSGKTRMVREHSNWSLQCFNLICQLSHLSLISLVSSLWPFFLLNNYPFLCSLIGHFLLFFNLIGQVVLVTKAKSRRYRTGPPAVSEVPLMWYGTTELKTSTAPVLRGWYVSHI